MKKITYIHDIRGIAAFFIVLIHCNIFNKSTDIIFTIWSHFLKEWTAVFVLISGFLFQLLINKYKFMSFMKVKIKNVISPYIIISIPAILIYVLGIKKDHNWIDIESLMEHTMLYVISFFYATGSHLGPLWFIPVLALIFLTSKPLSMLHKNEKLFIFASVLSVIAIVFTSRPPQDSNPILAYFHFLPVYIIGMMICFYKDALISPSKKHLYLILFLSAFISEIYFELNSSFSILSKIILFLFLCSYFMHLDSKGIRFKILSFLADISFTLYFLHGYFVGVIRTILSKKADIILQDSSLSAMLISILATAIITLIISMMYISLSKLKINTRMVIGS
ncbi:TPA: acyltransferase family protein [Raoultella ornithinolytica]|jgi:peptidoglycan/LPS O-acetylase OafA/YrhL|uniref:acyltransferase family protein n=1 Tax=Raoultella ornithinolytica TaxID=54291 RepID=UPI00195279F1|nr:acyltransferase family protein [Raoultella ornithinolytica]MBM6478254.1 acyltransferase family protein [Raoultella ornithinolytica]MCF6705562.1 acyltransferase family protein [Raoultella ornithinolytica]HDS8976432.1 acyltransferase family protein [Raoultella ornithinolytica]HDT1249668.1 acyltransferase family protein [Raoultella ornithinolytica]